MNAQNILNANILDILFDGRNKSYGAYELRKNYNKRLVKAMAGMIGICLLLTMGSIFASSRKPMNQMVLGPEIDLSNFKEKEEKKVQLPKEEPKPQPQKQIEQARVTIPVITPDKDFKEEDAMKPIDELDNIKIGSSDISGEKGDPTIVEAPSLENSVTGGTGESKTKTVDDEGIFYHVEVPAQFPGGVAAWKKYLERNLNASLPAENGAQAGKYTVMVSFVVDKEGNISDVKAENSPGFGTEAEAIKIIKKGPKWQPALQNGRNVAYRAMQQVTFMVNED